MPEDRKKERVHFSSLDARIEQELKKSNRGSPVISFEADKAIFDDRKIIRGNSKGNESVDSNMEVPDEIVDREFEMKDFTDIDINDGMKQQ